MINSKKTEREIIAIKLEAEIQTKPNKQLLALHKGVSLPALS